MKNTSTIYISVILVLEIFNFLNKKYQLMYSLALTNGTLL